MANKYDKILGEYREKDADGIGDMLKATYDPAGGNRQMAFADEIPVIDTNPFDVGAVQFDTAHTPLTSAPGLIQWNSVDGTYDMGLLNSSVLQVGQETMFYGKASGAIANGDLCQFAGVQGDHILIKKAVGSEIEANPHFLVGVATENIANNAFGYVTWFGKINGIYTKTPANQDSADWLAGDILYFNVTTGQLTKTMPTVPNRIITVAAVIKEQTGASESGIIIVRPIFGQKLQDLDDVNGTPLTVDGQFPVWNNTGKYFDFTSKTGDFLKINQTTPQTTVGTFSFPKVVATTDLTSPLLIGGSAVGSVLQLKGTTGNGTLTSPAIQALVGNNGATTALTVLNNGNVGIGTTAPSDKLTVYDGAGRFGGPGYGQVQLGYDDGTNLWLKTLDSNRNLAFQANGTGSIKMTSNNILFPGSGVWNTSGNVGIGTTNPGQLLHVKNNASSYAAIDIQGNQTGDIEWLMMSGYPAAGNFTIREAGVQNSLTILKTSGNVGIGTTAPTYKLDVKGLTAASAIRSDIGFDIYTVPVATAPTAVVSAGGSVDEGTHAYNVIYTTALGQTKQGAWLAGVTATATDKTVTLTIPVSTDPRVTGRKIFRTKAGVAGSGSGAEYLLATIANNTDTTYVDTASDSTLSGATGQAYSSANTTSNYITVQGVKSMTIDSNLTAFGTTAGAARTTAGDGTFIGNAAGRAVTTGNFNTYVGSLAGLTNITGASNTALGYGALYYGTAGNNTAIGGLALSDVSTGANNTALGQQAGRYIADGTTKNIVPTQSTYLGTNTKASADNLTNEIVIGYNAIGQGSNSVTLGNTSITKTILNGNVGIGTTSPTALLHLKAGTATANTAPLKLTSGTLMTAPEAGAIEFLTDKYYGTITTGATRKEIKLVDQYYGELYQYENATATTIGTQNVYHAVIGCTAGLLNGFTLVTGIQGTIASVADYSGTVAGTILITDVAHGLLTGDIITIHATTNYNGTYSITKVTNDTFYVTKAYVSSQTGEWAMGCYLLTGSGSAGIYKATWSNTALPASNNETFKFELNKNTTPQDNIAASNKYGIAGDYKNMGASGLVSLAAGDRIWLSVKNETSGADITIRHLNVNLVRL